MRVQTFRVVMELQTQGATKEDVAQVVFKAMEPSGILKGGRIVKVTQTRGPRT